MFLHVVFSPPPLFIKVNKYLITLPIYMMEVLEIFLLFGDGLCGVQ